jgi:pimeloyl-ACP methyl ester carboxylesterase
VRRLKIGDRLVRLRDEGEGRRTPVVCVHGAGTSSVVWMDLVRRLAPRRRVLAPDLPGHGQSDRWHTPSIDLYRDAVGTICATLQIPKVVLVGHSLGALVALACAAAWPERVTALVLAATAPRLPPMPELLSVLEHDYLRAGALLARLAWSPSTPRPIVERWAGLTLTADADVGLADFRAAAACDAAALAARVRVPTLILGGADDLLTPATGAAELGRAIAGARVVVLPHAGHMVMLEQPDAFFAAVADFLSTAG